MLIDGRIYKDLKFDDINTLVSLREWIKDNLTLHKEDEKISDSHLILFLEYIKTKAREQRVVVENNEKGSSKKKWFDQIDLLIKRVKENESE